MLPIQPNTEFHVSDHLLNYQRQPPTISVTISDLIRQILDAKLTQKETFQFVCCCPPASSTNSSLTANCNFWPLAKFFSSGPSFVSYSGSANDARSDSMFGKTKVVIASQLMNEVLSPKAARVIALSASVLKCYLMVSCISLRIDSPDTYNRIIEHAVSLTEVEGHGSVNLGIILSKLFIAQSLFLGD